MAPGAWEHWKLEGERKNKQNQKTQSPKEFAVDFFDLHWPKLSRNYWILNKIFFVIVFDWLPIVMTQNN